MSGIVGLGLAGMLTALTLYRASYQSERADLVGPIALAGLFAALALRRLVAPQRQR